MIDETRVLFAEALKQPPEVRAALAGTLIESLEGTVDERAEEFWAVEIRRRLDDLDAGVVKTVPWSEARRQILDGSIWIRLHLMWCLIWPIHAAAKYSDLWNILEASNNVFFRAFNVQRLTCNVLTR